MIRATYLINTQLVLIDEMESSRTFDEEEETSNSLKELLLKALLVAESFIKIIQLLKLVRTIFYFQIRKTLYHFLQMKLDTGSTLQDRPRKNDEFYKKIYDWLENGGAKHVLYELKERDVEDFNPKSTAPHTVFREQMSVAGEHLSQNLLEKCLRKEEFPFTRDRVVIDPWNYLIGSRKIINLV